MADVEMAGTFEIHIRPASEPPSPRPDVRVEAAFDVWTESGDAQRTVSTTLDAWLSGTIALEGLSGDTVRVSVLAFDGATLVTRSVAVDRDRADVVLTDDEVVRVLGGGQLLPVTVAPSLVPRSVRLVPTGSTRPDYGRCALAVAVVESTEQLVSSGLG
ncbi:MAG: hypothetical protein L0K86_25810, partial [Actinomycetia bacterium]|nr:hypothetical protein [Actinomycetes bacterium]